MLDFIFTQYNYLAAIVLMMIGFYAMIAKDNLIKKIIGMNIFQTAVFLMYISIGKVEGGTAPIIWEQGAGDADKLKMYASDLGLNAEAFATCLDTGETTQKVLTDKAEGSVEGVQGTPSFRVNGEVVKGAQPFEVFKEVIDSKLV